MGRDKLKIAWLSAALVGFNGCTAGDPETRLREAIAAMETAVEARAPSDFVRRITEDFDGTDGLDRQGLRGLLAGQLVGAQRVEVILGPLDVTLHSLDRATVKLEVLVVGGRWLPERGERLAITSGWRHEDGEWRCYRARWRRTGAGR